MSTDARPSIIDRRLSRVGRIIAVGSGKGGVGKSLVSCAMALELARQGRRVGLFDLDIYGPSCHLILGAADVSPQEENGLVPPRVAGIALMSPVFFTKGRPSPLRGSEVSNVILELLAITQWGSLDDLIIDLPPGIGDEVLDVVRYMPRSSFLVVTTPSELAWAAVEKLLDILQELKRPILGVVENMVTTPSRTIQGRVEARGLPYLGELPYDGGVEAALGNAHDLPTTHFGMALSNLLQKLPSQRA